VGDGYRERAIAPSTISRMAQRPSGKKIANSLVAISSAAVLAVYAAGYERTRSAANRFDAQTAERRPASPPLAAPPADAPLASSIPSRSAAPEPALLASAKPAHTPDEIPPSQQATPSVEAPAPEVTPAAEPVAPKPEAPAPVPPPTATWKDGTYTGWGSSRHGDIQASVVVEGGRIASATIAQCQTRYSCSVIDKLPPEVAQRQSPEVDFVSGATQSTNAFYFAVVDALSKAK
jgi:uncharacterized protein with FMN-binding domain